MSAGSSVRPRRRRPPAGRGPPRATSGPPARPHSTTRSAPAGSSTRGYRHARAGRRAARRTRARQEQRPTRLLGRANVFGEPPRHRRIARDHPQHEAPRWRARAAILGTGLVVQKRVTPTHVATGASNGSPTGAVAAGEAPRHGTGRRNGPINAGARDRRRPARPRACGGVGVPSTARRRPARRTPPSRLDEDGVARLLGVAELLQVRPGDDSAGFSLSRSTRELSSCMTFVDRSCWIWATILGRSGPAGRPPCR